MGESKVVPPEVLREMQEKAAAQRGLKRVLERISSAKVPSVQVPKGGLLNRIYGFRPKIVK